MACCLTAPGNYLSQCQFLIVFNTNETKPNVNRGHTLQGCSLYYTRVLYIFIRILKSWHCYDRYAGAQKQHTYSTYFGVIYGCVSNTDCLNSPHKDNKIRRIFCYCWNIKLSHRTGKQVWIMQLTLRNMQNGKSTCVAYDIHASVHA